MKILLLANSLLLVCAVVLSCTRPRNILIITGGHEFEKEPFFEMFRDFGDITFTEKVHPLGPDGFSPAQARVDALVFYDMPDSISVRQREELLGLLERGTGMLFLHHALCGNTGWPEYEKIVGGKYLLTEEVRDGHTLPPSTYRHDVDMPVQVIDPAHPVTRGVEEFVIHDEIYGGFITRPEVQPLLRTSHPESSPVIAWAHQYARSRIVYLQLGHDHQAWNQPQFRRLLRNAIEWVSQ